jgi:hypothetical protein
MRALATAIVLTAALVVYIALLADRAVLLIQAGGVVGVGLGVAVLILPLIGVWYVVVQWRDGIRINRLTRRLADEDGLPDVSGLPRGPSGRVDRDAADEWFAARRVEVEAAPEDWRAWFRLAHAYDIAGDRRRAREAMRKALELGG